MRFAPKQWVNPRDRAEKKDCVVRAIAVAAQIRYADAHACCELGGRKPNRPFWTRRGLDVAKTLGLLGSLRFPSMNMHTLRICRSCFHGKPGSIHISKRRRELR